MDPILIPYICIIVFALAIVLADYLGRMSDKEAKDEETDQVVAHTVSVEVQALKDQLLEYLAMVKKGGQVVVTERGKPVAIIHGLADAKPAADE
jgi:prevent-host-death family protein